MAAAHAVGLVHGNVSAANVLLTEGGMALLADLGVGQMSQSAPGPADPAVDVRAVGGLLQQALDRCLTAVPAALLDAVAAAVAEDAAVRPDAASLATALRRSCPAAPLLRRDPGPLAGSRPRLPAPPREGAAAVRSAADPEQERPGVRGHAGRRSVGAGPSGRQAASGKARSGRWLSSKESGAAQVVDRPGRRRYRLTGAVPRRLLVAAAAAVILAAGAGIGWASGRGGPTVSPLPPAVTTPAAAPRAVGVDGRAELDRIDAARAVAFSAVNPALLEAADAPGSPALAADRKALARLKARGLSADGVRHRLLEVRSVLQSATGATLRVVDKRTEVTTVDGTGQVVGTLPLRPRAAYDIELVRGPAGWRLARVTPVAGAPSTETPRS